MKVDTRALQQVYAQFPSLKVNTDKGALEAAATKVLGASGARELMASLQQNDVYLAARSEAISQSPDVQQQQPKRAVVSGLSAGGMLAAAVLAKAGYQVDAVELRDGYTRNIQFSTRQAMIDELASIEPALAEKFLDVAAHIVRGSHSTLNGEKKFTERAAPKAGDPMGVPQSGEEMLNEAPITLVECKMFERVVFDWLKQQPNVTLHTNHQIVMSQPDELGRYSVSMTPRKGGTSVSLGTPDLVVVAEGGGSAATRKSLGIESMATSPASRMVAGTIERPSGGRVASHYVDQKKADGGTERILAMALGSAKADKTWAIVEVPTDELFDPGPNLDPTSKEYRDAQQSLIEKHFRSEAALVIEGDISEAKLEGPFEGSRPTLFTLQQKMSNKATAGANVLTLGDFVGTGHFIVGGGVATATVSHIERLKDLVFDLELGLDKAASLAKYGQGAIADTLAWGRRGVYEFYPEVKDRNVVSEAYVKAVTEWVSGKNKDPLAALEKLLVPHGLSLPPIGTPKAA
ncbi:MAG: hypothetical protein JNK82_39335 [Myxococcaceae bacterium]|nr:hypothetical protein [Myxococcaceae bacterium]